MFKARLQFTLAVVVATITLLLSLPAFSRPRTPLEERLLAGYKDKPQMLQGFYCGKKLKFDADAKLQDGGRPGPWTVCGDVHIEEIEVRSDEVRIKARRVYLFYDLGKTAFQDADLLVSQKDKINKNLWESHQLEIRMAQPAGADEAAIQSSLDKLFRRADKGFSDIAPDFWKPYLLGRAGKNSATIQKEEQLPLLKPISSTVDLPGKKNPRLVFSPDPEFTAEAREYKFQGTVVIRILVDTEGKATELGIKRPLGLGLDERAIESIKEMEVQARPRQQW